MRDPRLAKGAGWLDLAQLLSLSVVGDMTCMQRQPVGRHFTKVSRTGSPCQCLEVLDTGNHPRTSVTHQSLLQAPVALSAHMSSGSSNLGQALGVISEE